MRQERRLVWTIGAMTILVVALSGCLAPPAPNPGATTSAPPASKPPASTSAVSAFKVGDMVAATWADGNLYLAKVTAVGDKEVTVQYVDDSSTKTVPDGDVKPIPARQWAVGDKVLAVWSSGRFYKGEIIKVGSSACQVKWDDGSAPSDVTADKIIAQ
jgi:hypothetical protein